MGLTYAQATSHVTNAAEELRHPQKAGYAADPLSGQLKPRHQGKSHPYGRVVYIEGGHVAVKIGGKYLIAEGADHEQSMDALAHYIGAQPFDSGVEVREVSEADFYAALRS